MHTIVDDIPASVPVQFSLLGSPEIPDFSVNHVCGEVRWAVAECICPQTCDCESEEDGYVSNHCPEHASNSVPCPDCPLCALKYQLYIHGGEFK